MFTGIIEHTGTIEALSVEANGGRVTIHAPSVAPSLAVSNSIAVNGCCLTIVDLHNGRFSADLSGETICKTSFGAKGGELKKGSRVNLEQHHRPRNASHAGRRKLVVRSASARGIRLLRRAKRLDHH